MNNSEILLINHVTPILLEESICKDQINNVKDKRGPKKGSKRKIKELAGILIGGWTYDETKKYAKFLRKYRSQFEDRVLRRKNKIFLRMAKFVKSRTSDQCRSHHQKVENKIKNIDMIIE